MKFSILKASALAQVILASMASAQTWSACNPMKRTDCPPNPALSGTYTYDFTQKNEAAPDFIASGQGNIHYEQDGAHFRLAKRLDGPLITSRFYIMYGLVEVKMKAAPGLGIVSSVVFQSDVLDEIDWEWLGGNANEVQSNYFGKGDTSSYDRGAFHPVANHLESHTYSVEWTAQSIKWSIDGNVVRTLTPDQVSGGDLYPQTPMQIKLGIWAGGDPDNSEGTILWAGGETDYSKAPFDMVVEKVTIQDYSKGKYYVYSDKSGSAASIVADDGKIGEAPPKVTTTSHPPIASSEATVAPAPIINLDDNRVTKENATNPDGINLSPVTVSDSKATDATSVKIGAEANAEDDGLDASAGVRFSFSPFVVVASVATLAFSQFLRQL